MNRRVAAWALAALMPAAALAGCSGAVGVSSDQGFAAGDGSYTLIAPADRAKAPELTGATLDGKKITLSEYLGKVVVLNVWGSWCSPCRHEAPALVEAAARTKGSAQFIGLNTRDTDPAQAKAFVRAFKVTYPNIYDGDGSLLLNFRAVPPKAIPTTLVLDKQGRVAARILGEADARTLEGTVSDVAAGK